MEGLENNKTLTSRKKRMENKITLLKKKKKKKKAKEARNNFEELSSLFLKVVKSLDQF